MEENNPVLPQQPVTQPQPVKKPFLSKIIIAVFIIVPILILLPAGAYLFLNSNKQVACTTEAKICPDGSSVGRTGPKCEFQACPASNAADATSTPDPTANWKTYTGNGFSIKYPNSWTTEDLLLGIKNLTCIYLKEAAAKAITVCSSTDKFSAIYPEYINNQNNPKITMNGYDAYKDTGFAGKGGFYILNSNEQFVNISPGTLSDEALFNQMLSTFKFTNQASPTPTCRPRPACLDSNPRCLLPETSDMCPPKITPSP